jgi:hypothetical protein
VEWPYLASSADLQPTITTATCFNSKTGYAAMTDHAENLAKALKKYLHMDWTLSAKETGITPLTKSLFEATKFARETLEAYEKDRNTTENT